MRINNKDETLKKNYIQKYQFLIKEYELVKSGKHKKYKRVGEFYAAHGTCRQIFLKYYGRYKNNKDDKSLLPGKSGSIEVSIDSDGLLIQTGKYNFGKITMAPNASFQCTIDDIKYSFCSKNNAIIDSKKLDSFVNNLQNNDVEAELGMLTSFDEIPEEIQVIGIDCSCYIL